MPGSVGNPVQIGPFRRIVAVGWPSRYYAVRLVIGSEDETNASSVCEPSNGLDNGNATSYMTATSMEVDAAAINRLVGGEWEVVTDATVDGEPASPFTNTFGEGEAAAVYTEPHRFAELSGSAISDITVPANPGQSFVDTTALNYEVIGRPLNPDDWVCGIGPAGLGGFKQFAPAGDYGAVTSPAPIGLAGITISHRGRTYEPIGVYLVPNIKGANPTVEVSAPIAAWVLCQRSDPTA